MHKCHNFICLNFVTALQKIHLNNNTSKKNQIILNSIKVIKKINANVGGEKKQVVTAGNR